MKHLVLDARGTRIHCVEEGTGPLVLMVHGFPESWYSWRHQIPVIAAAGFRAVAIDVRGYGRSAAPLEVSAYGMLSHVTDNLGVVEALGEDSAIIVGHDWGSPIAAHSALLRPDVFTAVALLSVPYHPPSKTNTMDAFAAAARFAETVTGFEEEFYIEYFQEPGRAEAEIEADARTWLRGFYIGASGDHPTGGRAADGGSMATVKKGGQLRDRLPLDAPMPAWLTEEDLDFYVSEFEHTGFRGPLNRYRNVPRDWVDLQPWRAQPIIVPSLFIGGDRDGPTVMGADAIAKYSTTLPGLRGSHILERCGHWVQQERPKETNELLVDWLAQL
jgi:pimeloyl-ACP methyl ester carboxylesterase